MLTNKPTKKERKKGRQRDRADKHTLFDCHPENAEELLGKGQNKGLELHIV
jgi:hypothetical protein